MTNVALQKRASESSRMRCLAWSILTLLLLWAAPASAANNDIHLHFLYEGKSSDRVALQQKNFRLLAVEYGLSITNPVTSTAETTGLAGLDIGVEFSLSDIPELKEHWRRAIEDERPDNQLFITRLRLRKGLPFSFELDGNIGFIYDSTSMVAGLGLKWALNEGFKYFPDLAVRGGVSRTFSSRDLDIFTVNVDFWMSKQFAIAGMFTLTPYAGYSLLYIRAQSGVLDPTPKSFADNESPETGNFVFIPENLIGHRMFFGLRIVWFFITGTLEGAFNFSDAGNFPDETDEAKLPTMISQFNAKISFSF